MPNNITLAQQFVPVLDEIYKLASNSNSARWALCWASRSSRSLVSFATCPWSSLEGSVPVPIQYRISVPKTT